MVNQAYQIMSDTIGMIAISLDSTAAVPRIESLRK